MFPVDITDINSTGWSPN